MKITKKELKKMILQEFNSMAINPESREGDTNAFEIFAFENHMNAILGNVKQMDLIIRDDQNLDRKSLVLFKDKMLGDLHMAISHLEAAITARLKEQDEGF
mgnify:CR=1 FL=1|jgi:hypothetical protein|tara:strand:- start:70 stop:372 length:303 start_codon:yes stop_codon:yes gene_type:complete